MASVVIAPDGFGGTLTAREASAAIAAGWASVRPHDELILVPLSDGGEGLLDVVAREGDRWEVTEVAGPQGHPIDAAWLWRADGTAVIESARACGLALVPPERRSPMLATTYGVGQLLDAARRAGASRIVIGLGGSATVDGGAGALTALGFRPVVADGSGLKIGAEDLHRVAALTRAPLEVWTGAGAPQVEVLADVTTPLGVAARTFGPQKGATPGEIEQLERGLDRWAEVVERDLSTDDRAVAGSAHPLRERPGTGAAGGLGYALIAGLGARLQPGSEMVAQLVGLPSAVASADAVIVGEGRLDATSRQGKVVGAVAAFARRSGADVLGVVGQIGDDPPELDDVEPSAPTGRIEDAAAEVLAAATRLAARWDPAERRR